MISSELFCLFGKNPINFNGKARLSIYPFRNTIEHRIFYGMLQLHLRCRNFVIYYFHVLSHQLFLYQMQAVIQAQLYWLIFISITIIIIKHQTDLYRYYYNVPIQNHVIFLKCYILNYNYLNKYFCIIQFKIKMETFQRFLCSMV